MEQLPGATVFDCGCSLNCLFQGKLDTGKAAVMGHSFGGATTIQALSEDQRFL